MDQYIVSARKYRPSTFASVVGQKALSSTLKNAVVSGRLASSYLFCGSRGVGKTTCARIFAKAINCTNRTPDGEPCNECPSCIAFNNGSSLNIVELDAASNNGVEHIRALIEKVQVPPSSGRYRVFIVDEVHMLSSAAFNAFLKTLEEPPSYVVFILATTEKHKIIPTILSRCQIYDFHRITVDDMVDHMLYVAGQEGITADPAALNVIAQKADGAMRDALSIFDQVAASTRGNITYQATLDNLNVLDRHYYSQLLEKFLAADVLGSWMIYKEIRDHGFDSLFFINGLGAYLRDLMAASTPQTLSLIEASDTERAELAALAARCNPQFLLKAMSLCNDADFNYRNASGKQFLIELTLAKICQLFSPSPSEGGKDEGRLKPIAAADGSLPQASAPKPAPAPSATGSAPARPQTAPATPPRVAPAPARPATAPRRADGPVMRGPHISIRGTLAGNSRSAAAPDGATQAAAPSAPKRTAPFTLDQLLAAWDAYIAAHPKEHVLKNTMESGRPTPLSGNAFQVKVMNSYQEQELNRALPDILASLADALSNDTVEIHVKIIEEGEQPRHTLTDRELLASMAETHPMLNKFITEFKLKL